MHLLPCTKPDGILESAPRTSLRVAAETVSGRWDGFWCVADERYYTRCTTEDGCEQWFHFADEAPRNNRRDTPVIPLRPRRTTDARRLLTQDARRMVVFGSSWGSKTVLVGASRRRSPPMSGSDAGDRV